MDNVAELLSAVFVNTPLNREKRDLFHIDVQVKKLKQAVENGANFIGVFSEFGGGKTSIVKNFADEYNYKIQNICLWNCEGWPKNEQSGQMTAFTHSFLYQFAKIGGNSFTRNINRMMSKNYKQLSFSTDMHIWKKALLILVLISFIGIKAMDILVSNTIITSQSIIGICRIISEFYSNKYVIIAVLLLFLLLFFHDNTIMFSWKDDGIERELGEADAYEVFDKIINRANWKLGRPGQKYVINVEDLDRVTDKKEVCEFLKALYKFNSLLKNKKKYIFIISLSQKSYINLQNDNLCDKLFDYSMVLRPINREKAVNLVENMVTEKDDDNIFSDANNLNCSKDWFIKGDNLSIRTIKSRINAAVEIREAMSKDGIEIISFEKCAIVAYLESAFPMDVYEFTAHAGRWKEAFDKTRKSGGDIQTEFLRMVECSSKFSWKFKQEIKNLLDNGWSIEDYWQYFYRSPRNKDTD